MRAVIHVDPSAELVVAGLPIYLRCILTLSLCGVGRFTLVAQPEKGEALAATVERWAPDVAIDLRAPDEIPAASSQRVIVAKAPGLFSARAAALLLERGAHHDAALLAPGRDDAGLWVLSDETYAAWRKGGRLAAEHVDAAGQYCPVLTAADVPAAERLLFSWSIKQTDGFVSRHLNRPVSTWISRRLARFNIPPVYLTALTGVLALLMFWLLVRGNTLATLGWGCLFYHICSVADGLDGEIARAKFRTSARGAGLDTAVDMVTNLLFMIGISAGDARVYGPAYLWLGGYVFITAFAAIILMVVTLRYGPGGGSFDVLQLTIRRRLIGSPVLLRWFGLINALLKRDTFALAFAIMGSVGLAYAIPWIFAAGTMIWLAAILVNMPLMLRMNRADILPPHLQPPRAAPAGRAWDNRRPQQPLPGTGAP